MTAPLRRPQSPLDLRPSRHGTSTSGFLDSLRDTPPGNSRDDRLHRRSRGLCEECGRPLALLQVDATAAVWSCRCGYSTVAAPRSSLYKRAREQQELAGIRVTRPLLTLYGPPAPTAAEAIRRANREGFWAGLVAGVLLGALSAWHVVELARWTP